MSLAFGTRYPCDQSVATGPRAVQCAERQRRWVLVAAVLGSSLAFVEGSIVNLALPALQADQGWGSIETQWIVNGYLLALGSLMLIGGALGDRVGQKAAFIVGLLLFGIASLACALANSFGLLLGARIVQGVGAALLVPTSLALINVHFDQERRPRAIGIWAGASALTTALGPVLGGVLVDELGWRSVFFAIVPFAAAAIAVAALRLPASVESRSDKLDWPGALLLLATLLLISLALIDPRLNSANLALVAGGAVLFVGFLRWESISSSPMIPLDLFRNRIFSGANALTVALYFALGGALYFIPFNLIQIQGYSAVAAGSAFLPMTLLLGFGSAFASDQLRRVSPRSVLTVGALLAAGGFALFAKPGVESSYLQDWLPGILLLAVGMTLCVAPLTTVVMASIDAQRSGVASGINNTAARLAGVVAIALLTGIAVAVFDGTLQSQLASLELTAATQTELLAKTHLLAELAAPVQVENPSVINEVIRASYVAAFRVLMIICALSALLAATLAWLTLGPVQPAPNL
ncbi:MAG: MFS transporter [Pseudomonadota bacterium]